MKKMSFLFVFFIALSATHTHSMQQAHTLSGRITPLTADKLSIPKLQHTTAMLICNQNNTSQNASIKKTGGRSFVPSSSSKKIQPLMSDILRAAAANEYEKAIDTQQDDSEMPGAIFEMEL